MLVDANLLLYAVNRSAPQHDRAREWLAATLSGPARVGLPWQSLGAFLRIATSPRVLAAPLDGPAAARVVRAWLQEPTVWIPGPGARHASLLLDLVARYGVTSNLVPDAMLAALALEHGLTVCSSDSDFARFSEVRWENPVAVD